ncbi:hypothetical protein MGSAQ_000057 [marine sediment metagenome]|uniref:Uncharacterized protein n=1 Tax=marine sediment metagenome TaxID=412755 RepID=A0A1B6NYI0_9ZZZZ
MTSSRSSYLISQSLSLFTPILYDVIINQLFFTFYQNSLIISIFWHTLSSEISPCIIIV